MSEDKKTEYEEVKQESNVEEALKNLANKVGKSLPVIVGIGIAIWWVLYGMVEITEANLSLTDRIGLTLCTVVLAVIYSGLIAKGGFSSAKQTVQYKANSKKWSEAVIKGNKYKKEIELYAKDIAKENQYELRVANLEANGLYYGDYFDEEGNLYFLDYKSEKKTKHNPNGLTRKQLKIIKKCINIRIIIPTLFGSLSSKFFGVKREETQKRYESKTNLFNFILRVILSIFSVGFIVSFIGFNINGFIYAVFQIILWTSSGVSQRMSNYNFVLNKLLPQMVEKTLIINGYLSLSEEKQRYYEERVEIEKLRRGGIKKITYKGERQDGSTK
jgi:hypothetical protein